MLVQIGLWAREMPDRSIKRTTTTTTMMRRQHVTEKTCCCQIQAAFQPGLNREYVGENRIVRSPMFSGLGTPDGRINERLINHYRELARGGAGVIIGSEVTDDGVVVGTFTDADLVLGYLNHAYYLGGDYKISLELARKAIKEKIADPLGLDVTEAARSIVRILNSGMVDAISAVSVRRGEDPRRYAMVAAGGAGPVHAAGLAKALGIGRIIVPRLSSVFCAMGAVISDLRHDYVRTIAVRSGEVDFDTLNRIYREMAQEAHETLGREAITGEDRYFLPASRESAPFSLKRPAILFQPTSMTLMP
ncbi:MAG: hypothetical protein JRK53_27025 [Deltaproteobacteria bacterium]|nr:hypothetical protein [Deltaproteobacteria bacterium]